MAWRARDNGPDGVGEGVCGDHGAIACRGESVRIKISRPWQCGQISGSIDGVGSVLGGTSCGTTRSGGMAGLAVA